MPLPALDLAGRTAVVVGGTSGIGLALAEGLAEAGADVIPASRRAELVDAAAARIETLGRRTLRATVDVSQRASLERLLTEGVRAFSRIDILVNCAGRTIRTPTLDLREEDWHDVIETNATGTLRACQVFGRHMVANRYGRIVNIASLSSLLGLYEVAAYAASKAAVAALTRSLAVEWAPHGVCVNALLPGVFRTPMTQKLLDDTPRGREFLMRTPMQRFGRVEELAGAAVFLASDAASFVTGHLLAVDGGFLASGVNQ